MSDAVDPAIAHLHAVTNELLAQQGDGPSSSSEPQQMVPNIQASVTCIRAAEASAVMKVGEVLDTRIKNWSSWSQSMELLFNLFEVHDYVLGRVTLPEQTRDPVGASNWQYNDTFAMILIMTNISPREKVYTNGCPTSHRMWRSLQSMHKLMSYLIATDNFRSLMTRANEGENISDHLTKLKYYWDQLILFGDQNYHISDSLFKRIIASSLPSSWDQFTVPYVSSRLDEIDIDPCKHIDSQQLIGIIKQEYKRKFVCRNETSFITQPITTNQKGKKSLASRISMNASDQNCQSTMNLHCMHW